MTANRRIFLNIVATYGRSLYALVLGLFSARWVLMSLGTVDYGLMGLVGGLVSFVGFLNGLMASAVGRYYAFAVGQAKKDPTCGLEECRKWFNTALTIHTVLPFVLVAIGYPIGIWAVEHFLSIPPDRVAACVWVWRFACISCFVSMVSVPFNAMYNAKQEIAELTIFSVAATTINFAFLCYMISHPGAWLVRYSAWSCFIAILPTTIIGLRAIYAYKECRFRRQYLFDLQRIRDLLFFACGRFICALSQIVSGQGKAILVNKLLGPTKNAAMSIGSTLTGHTTTLMFSFQGAFYPAITNAFGAGDFELARTLSLRMCKFGTLSVLIFIAPLISEAENVLTLWLKSPPAGSAVLCMLFLVQHCISRLVDGHWMIVFASGKISGFNATECIGYFASLIVVACLLLSGMDIAAVGVGSIIATFFTVPAKLYFARKHGGLSVLLWLKEVVLPLVVLTVVTIGAGVVISISLPPTFLRIVLTTLTCEIFLFPLAWLFVLDCAEKKFLINKISSITTRIIGSSK